MDAILIDNTKDHQDYPKVRTSAWGIVDIKTGPLDERQAAGICVYIDLDAVGFQVTIPVAEALMLLSRAVGGPKTDPLEVYGDEVTTVPVDEAAPIYDPIMLGENRIIETIPGDTVVVESPEGSVTILANDAPKDDPFGCDPSISAAECGCEDVEDLI